MAIDLGIHSKIEASNSSARLPAVWVGISQPPKKWENESKDKCELKSPFTKDCHWEPRSKTGRTEGQDAAAEAGVAALSVTSSIMACHEAYQAVLGKPVVVQCLIFWFGGFGLFCFPNPRCPPVFLLGAWVVATA